jgi:hypothetical protein
MLRTVTPENVIFPTVVVGLLAHALGEPAAPTVLSSYLVWLVTIVGSSSD